MASIFYHHDVSTVTRLEWRDSKLTCQVVGTCSRMKSPALAAVILPTPGFVSSEGTVAPAASTVASADLAALVSRGMG